MPSNNNDEKMIMPYYNDPFDSENEVKQEPDLNSEIEDVDDENKIIDIAKVNKEIDIYTKDLYERNKHVNNEISTLIENLTSKIENKFDVQLIGNLLVQLVNSNISNNSEITKLIKVKTDMITKITSKTSKPKNDDIETEDSMDINDKITLLDKYYKSIGQTNDKLENIKKELNDKLNNNLTDSDKLET